MQEPANRYDFHWALAYSAFLGFMLLTGGISVPSQVMLYAHTGVGSLILIFALWRLGRQGFPSKLAKIGTVLAAAALGLVLAQLVSLPQVLWQFLPEHALVLRNGELLGQIIYKMPLSLSPEHTRIVALSLMPALASYLGALTVSPRYFILCGLIVIACATIGVVFSLLQIAQGPTSAFYIYESEPGIGVGTFNNHNFFAAEIYSSIVFAGMLFAHRRQTQSGRPIIEAVFAVVFCGIALSALALTGSRSGILLSMLAILGALFLVQRHARGMSSFSKSSATVIATLVGLLIVAQSSMFGILRLASSDIVDHSRLMIFERSEKVLAQTFPIGSGFGTFVPMYQLYETPQMIAPEIINHAHNDWLEIAIEGGLPAILLEVAFVVLIFFAFLKVWRPRGGEQQISFRRGSLIVASLLMLHSLVDYPLRTPAMMTLFAMCCAIALVPPLVPQRLQQKRKRAGESYAPKAFKGTSRALKPNIH